MVVTRQPVLPTPSALLTAVHQVPRPQQLRSVDDRRAWRQGVLAQERRPQNPSQPCVHVTLSTLLALLISQPTFTNLAGSELPQTCLQPPGRCIEFRVTGVPQPEHSNFNVL